ncbi:hypothetical protein Tco_0898293 [Tanacetum coccineum]
MQVNVKFPQQIQPEWPRFVTIVKHANYMDKNANPLALVVASRNYLDDYYQAPLAPKLYKTHTPSSRQITSTRTLAASRNKGKEIIKPPTPPCESASEENDEEQETNEEPDEKELEAHYMYMAMIQEVLHAIDDNFGPTYDVEPLENADSNVIPDSSDMYDKEGKEDQNNPITHDIKLLVHDLLIPLAHKALKDVRIFENALKEEMLEDLKYVKSVEKEVDDLKMEIDDHKSQLENDKTDFPKVNDLLLKEFYEKDFLCVILLSFDDIDEYFDMACKIS